MPTITRKIELHLCTEELSDEQQKAQRLLLYHINDNLYKAANNVSSKLYLDEHVSSMVRLKHDEYLSLLRELARAEKKADDELATQLREKLVATEREMTDQELAICKYATEMSTQSLSYRFVTELETKIFAKILDCLKQGVYATFNSDSRDVKRGERAIRNYKKGMPIPFAWDKSVRIEYEEKEKDFFLRWYNDIRFKFHFGRDRSNNRLIVSRCMKLDKDYEGDYQLCNSSIQIVKRDGSTKYFLLLVVKIPQEHVELNKKIVVGVDLGINYPAYAATNCTEERMSIGDREHFLNTRMQFQRRFKSLQRLKGTTGGKGRNKKLEPLERLRKAEHNWVHTQNHLFSLKVVNFAVQTHAATIHLEDLSGFGKDDDGNADERKEFVLRNWSYYELQNMIKYKAKKFGIQVEKIRPAYTSQTCSWCGQRGFRQGITFICENPECKKCGEKENADYNAARNIANSKDIIKDKDE